MPNGEGFVKGRVVKVDQGENGVVAVSAIRPVVVIDHGRARLYKRIRRCGKTLSRAEARRRREVMEGTPEIVKNPSRRDQ